MTEKPFVRIPIEILDKVMRLKKTSEIKVILAVCRKTIGWNKPNDQISWSQFHKVTGMSPNGIRQGLALAIDHGFIVKKGSENSFSYEVSFPKKTIPDDDYYSEDSISNSNQKVLLRREHYSKDSSDNDPTKKHYSEDSTTQKRVLLERERSDYSEDSESTTQKIDTIDNKEIIKENDGNPLTHAIDVPQGTIEASEKILNIERGNRKGPKVIDQPQSRPLGYAWCVAFRKFYNRDYFWIGKDDDRALSQLEGQRMPLQDIISLAERAWKNKDSFHSRNAISLRYFAYNLNQILQDNPVTETKSFKATGVFSKNNI